MPLVKKIRTRGGVNMVVMANAELLFTPSGELSRWKNSLSQRVRHAVADAAPRNKRHRWSHYGPPLKKTIKASSDIKISAGGGRIFVAVGSSAPYALFVDQGTRDFLAKILPPWAPMSPSLYEHTWKVPVNDGIDEETGKATIAFEEVGRIRVRGQAAQHFFSRGLTTGMTEMGLHGGIGAQNPIGIIERPFPEHLADFVTTGYDGSNALFMKNLDEWRKWRDLAWGENRLLGQGYNKERTRRELNYVRKGVEWARRREARREERLAKRRAIQERYRRRNGAVSREEYRQRQTAGARERQNNSRARASDRAKFLAAMNKKYGADNVDAGSLHFMGGRWVILVKRGGRGGIWDETGAPARFPGAASTPDDDW